jgi:hypothetical protein
VLLLIALPLLIYLSLIGLTFSATQTSCLAKLSPGKSGKGIATLEGLLTQPIADKDPYQ